MKVLFRSSTALILAMSVVACATPGADIILAQPEATQRAAFEQCSARLGVPAQLQKLNMRDGRVNVFAVEGNGVTLAQARSLNQCSREVILATHGGG